ncbi:MAG: DNA double-strand break repair nuclease NurA [Chloroflexota bacterium]|nr:DNA double-strand break repair nuclease NurA [Chloroflexota bacterium]
MANFIDRLSEQVVQKKDDLKKTLRQDASANEESLARLVRKHWHKLPPVTSSERRPAFAVDGSRAVRHLANGAYLFVAQALIVGERAGERQEDTEVDVRILPGATPTPFVERFAELMMHRLEAGLASKNADKLPAGGVIFLDGALYGQLPQLYPLSELEGIEDDDLPTQILDQYLHLFRMCKKRNLILVSIAKTSHEATHTRIWWRDAYHKELAKGREISDSEAIYRWTDRAAGYTTPLLFGTRSFSSGSRQVLLEKVKSAPAIVSFFVRLADFDDALRIDVPASCLGRRETIDDVEEEQLIDQAEVVPILELLAADYGGLEVYNALLYSVDREVRLRQDMMDEVYLSLIQNTLGSDVEIRLDRSERRFHSR